ncbi:hypothetical protein C8J57DRAFT_1734545, partial [Mycena rebaudengoi]
AQHALRAISLPHWGARRRGPRDEHDVPARVAPGVEWRVGWRGAGLGHGRGRQPAKGAQDEVRVFPH